MRSVSENDNNNLHTVHIMHQHTHTHTHKSTWRQHACAPHVVMMMGYEMKERPQAKKKTNMGTKVGNLGRKNHETKYEQEFQ